MKEVGDRHLRTKEPNFSVGDLVWYQPPKQRISSKTEPCRKLELFKIVFIRGSSITAVSTISKHKVNRNSSCFRKSTIDSPFLNESAIDIQVDSGGSGEQLIEQNLPTATSVSSPERPILRSSVRERVSIQRLQVDPMKKTYN